MDMRVEPIGIDSGDKLGDIEHHFRVLAGPGAGKTHWLVNHIKEVLHTSERLDKSRKVACITYTNTAVQIIRDRLGSSSNQVEVSTIHSFLYKHVIKPYIHFIADDYGFKVSKLDGHDEFSVNRSKCISWLKEHPNSSLINSNIDNKQLHGLYIEGLVEWLSSITCSFDSSKKLVYTTKRIKPVFKINKRSLKALQNYPDLFNDEPINFKRIYWSFGELHHEDVLFFSFQIIKNYPFVLDVLRAKFPYFFIDEFQDSNPIQVELLRQIGERETIVGVIGDKAQSIFQFQGANPEQFSDFHLEGIQDYKIDNNRRSTQEVINLLNHIRRDFEQRGQEGFNGSKPVLYIGDRLDILHKIKSEQSGEGVITLSRKNITANALRKDVEGTELDDEVFDKLKEFDNVKRYRLVIACVKAVELCRANKIKEALNEIKKYFSRSEQSKRYALDLLFLLNSRYSEYCDAPLINFYNILRMDSGIDKLPKISSGRPKDFYDSTNYKSLALCVNIVEDTSNNITIHKSKGAEFENVLLVLDDEKKLNFITTPDLKRLEEHRLQYVAVSRVIQNLFITVPELSSAKAELIENLGLVDIIRLDDSLTHSTALN